MTYIQSHEQVARLGGLAAVALLCVAAAGCTAEPTPTPSSTATTHWKDGAEPAPNDLENTPYVKYLRDIAWAEAIAWNTGDFSIPEYNDHGWGMEAMAAQYNYQKQDENAYVYLAPRPFVPIRIGGVAKEDDNPKTPPLVVIYVCNAPETAYKKMIDPDLDRTLDTKPRVVDHVMQRWPDGTITDSPGGTDLSCDDVDVPVALFDTPPRLPELPVTEPKRTAPPAAK